jgi:uncharacterized membrane protein
MVGDFLAFVEELFNQLGEWTWFFIIVVVVEGGGCGGGVCVGGGEGG